MTPPLSRLGPGRVAAGVLLVAALAAWLALLLGTQGLILPHFCSMAATPLDTLVWSSILVFNPPGMLAFGWLLMVLAMMLPLLLAPVEHVRASVFRQQRWRAISALVAGYVLVWATAGLVVVPLAISLRFAFGDIGALAATGFAALLWQASPAKQFCLNRCHAFPALSPFAGRAEREAARYGVTRGLWCVGNCGPLMLFATATGAAHLVVMGLVAIWVFGEQIERPARPAWRWRGPSSLGRMALYAVAK